MGDEDIRVITWNIFHGQDGARLGPTLRSTLRRRGVDDGERLHLNRKWIDEMADAIVACGPTFAALQEVPPNAVDRLARRTGMRAIRAVMPPLIGPTATRGRLADRNPDLWRTHEGAANVVLAAAPWELAPGGSWTVRHNPPAFALRHGHRLRIGARERVHWVLEPRRLVAGRFLHPNGHRLTIASMHCHNSLVWDVIAEEVRRVVPKVLDRVPEGEPVIVAGDLNAAGRHHPAIDAIFAAGLGEDTVDDLVLDHIFQRGLLVRRAPAALPTDARHVELPWSDGSRTVLLSDHEIVSADFTLPR